MPIATSAFRMPQNRTRNQAYERGYGPDGGEADPGPPFSLLFDLIDGRAAATW